MWGAATGARFIGGAGKGPAEVRHPSAAEVHRKYTHSVLRWRFVNLLNEMSDGAFYWSFSSVSVTLRRLKHDVVGHLTSVVAF